MVNIISNLQIDIGPKSKYQKEFEWAMTNYVDGMAQTLFEKEEDTKAIVLFKLMVELDIGLHRYETDSLKAILKNPKLLLF